MVSEYHCGLWRQWVCLHVHTSAHLAVSHHVVTDDWTHDLEPVKWISYFFKLLLQKKGDYRDIGGTVTGFVVIW